MGIGKSSCQDVCMWNLCGSKEVSKIDSGVLLTHFSGLSIRLAI